MTKPPSRRLVIDANVARSAGPENAISPTAKRCRNFLSAVYLNRHQLVWTPQIEKEWLAHESRFTRRWRLAMERAQAYVPPAGNLPSFQKIISARKSTAESKRAMLKDCFLLEAAVATDKLVISCDDRARGHYQELAKSFERIRDVAWTNPDCANQRGLMSWLARGAEPTNGMKLGKGSDA